jgi:uncharacterized protein
MPSPTRITRHAERAREHREDLYEVLDAEHQIGTLSTVVDDRPWVVPMLYARVADRILLHGSTGAGALRHVAAGAPAALCVTHLDGWVYAHTLFDSSANYRSVVVHSTLVVLTGEEAAQALTDLADRMLPGRSSEVPAHTRKQLAATQALAMNIVDGQWTVKIREGGPGEPANPQDVPPDLWTGVLPIRSAYGDPIPAPRVTGDVPPSPSIHQLMSTA